MNVLYCFAKFECGALLVNGLSWMFNYNEAVK